ncbi:hypothetical protein A5731_12890 [Mycolicibacterium conceptionense]|uniref:hypothetical protein n=1 Tax=Mycolicibacterium conceptionense TaxID=451644 RepID=UPI0007EB8FEC|nr:hypothetical protein [Mycolicibacterium conceptionense]OBB06861.1 hypothetical protein A5718_18635 [Mycolicibacterium conceptionense]OBF03386.1 hypothetical protein A5731_12890 [Mycolicibacterium conceptionense]
MRPEVWISTTTSEVTFDYNTPGSQWEHVGTLDTAQQSDLTKNLQVLLGHRRTAPRLPGFYLSGDPESAWVQAAKQDPTTQSAFWIAIDPWGTMRASIRGAPETYFVSNEMATVTRSLARRAPEPHPGLRVKPVMIGIKVKRNDNGLFTRRVHD